MRPSPENPLFRTHALLRPETALPAIEAMSPPRNRAELEGLVELVHEPPNLRAAMAALEALREVRDPIVLDALAHALHGQHAPVRILACRLIRDRKERHVAEELRWLLSTDEIWMVRRAALEALADYPEPQCRDILLAHDDPHWRVRHALVRGLLGWSDRERIDKALSRKEGPRAEGIRLYLRYRWGGVIPEEGPSHPPKSVHAQEFWDWDPAVVARELERMGLPKRRHLLDLMPELLAEDDDRVQRIATEALRRFGEPSQLAAAITLLDDPRNSARSCLLRLWENLNEDRKAEVLRLIEGEPPRIPTPEKRPLPPLSDSHPYRRAERLTAEQARALMDDPGQETSWHVLTRAARMCKVPRWEIEPEEPWTPEPAPRPSLPQLPFRMIDPPHARLLGPEQWRVAPLGISGHYGLPAVGFARAIESGVNVLFWEPNYQTLTTFSQRISSEDRESLYFIVGTFEADEKRIRRDVERALRLLKLDTIPLFLLFWTRSWKRINDMVRGTLESLQRMGMIRTFGLSTHSRSLAVEALESGWNPVMVRHSAAHRGAEEVIFPKAIEVGTGLITFNNSCYGRLLNPPDEVPAPSASDCYRYAMKQPGVALCLSAPATLEQLEENLQALHDPYIPPEREIMLKQAGDVVYREDKVFRRLVREL